MAKGTTVREDFLADCEPYFLDAAHTIAQFAQRNQEIVRRAVEQRWNGLVSSLGFEKGEVDLLDYWVPDKLQKAKPMDEIGLGVKLKVADRFEGGIYRYRAVEERDTGVAAYTWIKGRSRLDQLSKQIDNLPDSPPAPEDAWDFATSSYGSYFITRSLNEIELHDLDTRIEELIAYYSSLMTKLGGVKRFLA